MPSLKQFDPRDLIISWGSILLDDVSDGTFVTVEYDEDAVKKHVGAKGGTTATISANKGGSMKIVLNQGGPNNDQLSAAAALQRRQGNGLVKAPLLIKHTNGTTLCVGAETWIKKESSLEFGDDHSPREWMFDIAELDMFIGGSIR